jgi:hypothetical protein
MNNSRITYAPHTEATPKGEVAALANVYRLILDSAKQKGRFPDKNGPDDAKERSKNDSSARQKYTG